MDALALAAQLFDIARIRVEPAGQQWLDRVVAEVRPPLDREAFAEAFTVAARRVGKASVSLRAEELQELAGAGVTWRLTAWGVDNLIRSLLLLRAAAALPADEFEALVEACYRPGDTRERQAVLRCLAMLPAPERFLSLAVEACRTSIQPVFEAIACENPYPAAYFPDPSFNQMVLKALFTGVALRRILGLDERITDELRRMAADYASERRAAARSVPPDIERLLGTEEHRS